MIRSLGNDHDAVEGDYPENEARVDPIVAAELVPLIRHLRGASDFEDADPCSDGSGRSDGCRPKKLKHEPAE